MLFPVDPRAPEKLQWAVTSDVVFALVALLGVAVPWRIASALILLVAFFGSFVWGLGWYFVFLPAFFPVGLGDVLYLVAAIMIVLAALRGSPRRAAG